MGENSINKFKDSRERSDETVMKYSSDKIKKFYSLDAYVYQDGALPRKIKELIGLTSSLVLRCDDCVMYHLVQCFAHSVTDAELEESIAIGLVVGGSITIPHIRKAFAAWDEFKKQNTTRSTL